MNPTSIKLDNEGLSNIDPLASLFSLQKISIKSNNISDIWALGSCKNLTEMNLEGNPIETIASLLLNMNNCPTKRLADTIMNELITKYCFARKNDLIK